MIETTLIWIGATVIILAAIPVLIIAFALLYFKAWDYIVRIFNLNNILYNVAVKLSNERRCKQDGREYKDRTQLLAENKELLKIKETLTYIRDRTGPLSEGTLDINDIWEKSKTALMPNTYETTIRYDK